MADLNTSVDMFEEESFDGPDWRGTPLDRLRPQRICTYPAVRSTDNHTVMFKLPILSERHLEPHPTRPADKWDDDHVHMPHSPENLFPVSECELKSRWEIIVGSLSKPVNSSEELENAIMSYNSQSPSGKLTFEALHEFLNDTLKDEEAQYFLHSLLPNIVKLAFEIEDKFRGALPILRRGHNRSISMSQVQAAVLLANAFLCTFPRRSSSSQQSLPYINFYRLFQTGSLNRVQQKLKCFTNYFRRVLKKRPTGVITYTRRHVRPSNLPRWSESDATFSDVYISSTGTIEENEGGFMEIDFANRLVGGGILGRGSVQEEIRFAICPELVVSRLFCEALDDTEALIVTGCERFNNYEGYGNTFTWSGNYDDSNRPRDAYHRLNTILVAIDATRNNRPVDQFKSEVVTREVNKAYAGFSFGQEGAIATGNWGSGAFKGDPLFKFLLQLMAASVCQKPLAYYTFGDKELRDKLFEMHSFLRRKNVTVGTLWKVIMGYCTSDVKKKSGPSLYDFVYYSQNTDADPGLQMERALNECSQKGRRSEKKNKRKFENDGIRSSNSSQENKKSNDESPSWSAISDLEDLMQQVADSNDQVELSSKISVPSSSRNVFKNQGSAGVNSSKAMTSPPDVDNLTIAPKDIVVRKTPTVDGFVTKKLSLKSDKPKKCSVSLDDSADATLSNDVNRKRPSAKNEPVNATTCSLRAEDGRKKCLEADQQRWDAYHTAMTKFGCENRIDDTSPDSSRSSVHSRTVPPKRKISDYFQKASPR